MEDGLERTKWKKHGRNSFAKRLNKNIKKYSKSIMNPGANVSFVTLNYDFAHGLIEIFMDTIIDILLEGDSVNVDQFGKFEIRTQPGRVRKSPLVQNKEFFIPELKMIRFFPAKRLKERLNGTAVGRYKRNFGFTVESYDDDEENFIEEDDMEDGN